MSEQIKNVKELSKFLKREGYDVTFDGTSGRFEGHNVCGGFHVPSDECYRYINGAIAADHVDCFDKYSKCPLVMKFPIDPKRLVEAMDLLGTKKGFEVSNSYDYLDDNPFPREVE